VVRLWQKADWRMCGFADVMLALALGLELGLRLALELGLEIASELRIGLE